MWLTHLRLQHIKHTHMHFSYRFFKTGVSGSGSCYVCTLPHHSASVLTAAWLHAQLLFKENKQEDKSTKVLHGYDT